MSAQASTARLPDSCRRLLAFTLIELMVVIGIIVLLIGILVPALASARVQAQKAATDSLLTGLQSNITQYSTIFNGAIPGPIGQGTTVNGGAGTKISGAQNLLLGLSYALGGSGTPIPGTSPARAVVWNTGAANGTFDPPMVDPTQPNGPVDYSMVPNKQSLPFYNPSQNDLKSYNGTNMPGPTGWTAFPVIVDRFSDPLPILYFRCDTTTAITNSGAAVPSAWAAQSGTGVAAYYRAENSEFLDGNLISMSTGSFDQGAKSSYSSAAGFCGANGGPNGGLYSLAGQIMAQFGIGYSVGSGTWNTPPAFTARGSYVLISAGADRIYGIKNAGTAAAPSWGGGSDDLVRVGRN